MSDVELCRETYRQMYRAMIAKDAEGLNAVLEDSFVLVHMTGMRQNKKAFVQTVMNGTLNYYSCEDGSLMSFMDRAFFAGPKHKDGNPFAFKPAAAVASARRAGTTSALDQMNKYFLHGQLPVISSRYWNMVGVIEEGNTAKMGRIIAEQLGADVFELVPVVPYPEDYDSCLDVATEEQRTDARPEYEGGIENWEQYDTVFIGYPIWWGEIPNIVYTFMEAYDFSGKTAIPFNTHEGSGQAHSQRDIEGLLTSATVLKGLAVRGTKAQNDADGTGTDVANWLKSIGLAQ